MLSFHSFAKEVRVAFGEKLPPFIIPETNSGIELDIMKEALAFKGHKLVPIYLPMGRISLAFKSKTVDVVMMDVGESLDVFGGIYGEPPVLYDNYFITLKNKKIKIKKSSDLKGLRINAFVGALKRYPEWLTEVSKTDLYVEKNDQSVQPNLLFLDRVDVVLSDINIFKYYSLQSRVLNLKERDAKVEFHSFTQANPIHYQPVFQDKSIRDDYNLGLKEIFKKGRDKAIYQHYLKEALSPVRKKEHISDKITRVHQDFPRN